MYALLLALCAPAAADLGGDDYDARELATARFRSLGWAARPLLTPHRADPSPEVRRRVAELLRPSDAALADLAACRWLVGPEAAAAAWEALDADPAARDRLARSAYRLKLLTGEEAQRLADNSEFDLVGAYFGELPLYYATKGLVDLARMRAAHGPTHNPVPEELP